MTVVWKFPFSPDDVFTVDMPRGSEPLSVDMQGRQLCIWARVDPSAPIEARAFRMAGTGHPLSPEVGRHIGSFQVPEARLVFHVFEWHGETP